MKRIFRLIVILACASVAASSAAHAQSRRVRHSEPPKDERADKSEQQDKTKETKDDAKESKRDEPKAGDDKVSTGKEVTERAVIRAKPNPAYPRGARRYQVQGVVKLRIILGADGKVGDEMEVLEGLPHGVTEEAIKAARLIEFEPARKDGRPVSQYVTVLYHFRLH